MPHTVEFSEDLKSRIRESQRKIADVLPFLDDVEACGVGCAQQRELLETLRKTLAEIENRFMASLPAGGN